MNEELAKELRDAGFPHKCKKHGGNDGDDAYCQDAEWSKESGKYICIPTLSELIEACGDDINILRREHDGSWSALTTKGDIDWRDGPTPDVAVGRLWLALNKPND